MMTILSQKKGLWMGKISPEACEGHSDPLSHTPTHGMEAYGTQHIGNPQSLGLGLMESKLRQLTFSER